MRVVVAILSLISSTTYCLYTQIDLYTAIKRADIKIVKECIEQGVDISHPIAALPDKTPLMFALELWTEHALKAHKLKKTAIICGTIGFISATTCFALYPLLPKKRGLKFVDALENKIVAAISNKIVPIAGAGLLAGWSLAGIVMLVRAHLHYVQVYIQIIKLLLESRTVDLAVRIKGQTAVDRINYIQIMHQELIWQSQEIEKLMNKKMIEKSLIENVG